MYNKGELYPHLVELYTQFPQVRRLEFEAVPSFDRVISFVVKLGVEEGVETVSRRFCDIMELKCVQNVCRLNYLQAHP